MLVHRAQQILNAHTAEGSRMFGAWHYIILNALHTGIPHHHYNTFSAIDIYWVSRTSRTRKHQALNPDTKIVAVQIFQTLHSGFAK